MTGLRITYGDCYMDLSTDKLGYASVICKDGSGKMTGLILDPNELGDLYRALKNHFEPEKEGQPKND